MCEWYKSDTRHSSHGLFEIRVVCTTVLCGLRSVFPPGGVPSIAWHGHLTHSQRLCIPSWWGLCNWEAASCIEGSGPGSLVKGRCPVASVWLCGWTTFPPCTSAKGMLNRLEKKNREEKSGMPCSRPGSLPHAAASSTRLEFKESQQRQLFGPSNIGARLGFPQEQSGPGPPPSLHSSAPYGPAWDC